MRTALLLLVLAALAGFGGRALYRTMASDETKIAWLLADEAAAFNDASVPELLPRFATDYRDETRGIDQPTLRGAVVWVWQNRRDAEGRFGYRVELPAAGGAIAVDGDTATASFPLQLFASGAAEPIWALQVEADLQRRDGTWWIVRSRHQTTAGAPPKSPLR